MYLINDISYRLEFCMDNATYIYIPNIKQPMIYNLQFCSHFNVNSLSYNTIIMTK